MWRFYVEVARNAFRRQLTYRWASLAGLFTNIFFVTLFSYVFIALYHARASVAGYNLHDILRYTWLIQAMVMVIVPFGWNELLLTIRSGEVVADLSKPCDFYWYWFSREVGRCLYFLLFRGFPVYLAGMVLFGIGLPGEWQIWLAYSLVLPVGAMLGIAYRYLYNVVAFWLIEARSLVSLAVTVALFFTGSYVPLPLFPPGLRIVADWLPFNGLMNLPAEIFLGKVKGYQLGFEVGRQALWLIVLTLFARWITTLATRRVVSQGG